MSDLIGGSRADGGPQISQLNQPQIGQLNQPQISQNQPQLNQPQTPQLNQSQTPQLNQPQTPQLQLNQSTPQPTPQFNNLTQPGIDVMLQKTQLEQWQDNAIFISQNNHNNVKLFNIQSFQTNMLSKSTANDSSLLEISRDTLVERECEKSPLFFKISGSVSYCQQLGGCCIFFHRGITAEQMRILYSVPCQQEIFDVAYKLYDNSIPSYKHLFQLYFSAKLRQRFRLLGLSEDTILLKVKNETPSQRNKFMYNSALLQLQMLRFDFIISPNLTPYYCKQFLTNNSCLPPASVPQSQPQYMPPPSSYIQTPTYIQPPEPVLSMSTTGPKTTKTTTPRKQVTVQQMPAEEEEDEEELDEEEEDSEKDDSDESDESTSNEYEENLIEPRPAIKVNTKSLSEELEMAAKMADKAPQGTKRRLPSPPASSLVSTATASTRDYIGRRRGDGDTKCSVEFVLPSNRSDTGITEKFAKIRCSSVKDKRIRRGAPSSTGLTANLDDLDLGAEFDLDEGGAGGDAYIEDDYLVTYKSDSKSDEDGDQGIFAQRNLFEQYSLQESVNEDPGYQDSAMRDLANQDSTNEDTTIRDSGDTVNQDIATRDSGDTANQDIATRALDSQNTTKNDPTTQDRSTSDPNIIFNQAPLYSDDINDVLPSTSTGRKGLDCEETLQYLLSKMTEPVEKSIFDSKTIMVTDANNKTIFNPKYLALLQQESSIEELQDTFNYFEDIHDDVEPYIKAKGYIRERPERILRALLEVEQDETNRLKQAVYIYLLSNLIKLKRT